MPFAPTPPPRLNALPPLLPDCWSPAARLLVQSRSASGTALEHVALQDHDSPALKDKKHWNSFNTEYFMPFENVLRQLTQAVGRLALDPEADGALLKRDLACHGCGLPMKTMPILKEHIRACAAVSGLPGV